MLRTSIVLSVIILTFGCADNSASIGMRLDSGMAGTGGEAGSGGTAGEAGSGGTAGQAGSGGSAGQAGSGGSAGEAGSGGSAGQAGSGGSAGQAGSGGSAGQAGSGGSAGQAGSGGSAAQAGSGGSAGEAGNGGSAGEAGSGGSAGEAGSGGTAGEAGAGGQPEPACETDDDCADGTFCRLNLDGNGGTCVSGTRTSCQACESNAECGDAARCVLIGEVNLCALTCDAFECDTGFECASASADGVGVNVCVYTGDICCPSGEVDLDGDAANGCEYSCDTNQRGAEICDESDNDCDGTIDEGFDFNQNTLHCGECGNSCVRDNMIAACVDGTCANQCEPGFLNADGNNENGCEAVCDASSASDEVCDGIDNDCDGPVDESYPTLGQACEITIGQCPASGSLVCTGDGNGLICDASADLSFALPEICDGLDNDCDGQPDDGFDLQVDPENCGACGTACTNAPNAAAVCNDAICAIACNEGFTDRDGDPSNGCEPDCGIENDGSINEICDGEDNDNDCLVDEDYNLQTDANHCGACDAACINDASTTSVCTDGTCGISGCAQGYYDLDGVYDNGCEYRCDVTNSGVELCDTQDNDCDGNTDEGLENEADSPDEFYEDLNCDQFDGVITQTIFVSTLGDDNNDGGIDSPVATINRGIALASVTDALVAIDDGEYAGIVNLEEGVSIFGGYRLVSCPDRLLPANEQQGDDPEDCSYLPDDYRHTNMWTQSVDGEALIAGGHDVIGNAYGMRAVDIHRQDTIEDALVIARLTVSAPNAQRPTQTARSSYGLFIDESRINVRNVTIRGGDGANAFSRPNSGTFSRDGDDGVGRLTGVNFNGNDGVNGDEDGFNPVRPNGGSGASGIECFANGIEGNPGVGGPGGEGGSNANYSGNRGDDGGPGSASTGALGETIGGSLGAGGRGGREDRFLGPDEVIPVAGADGSNGRNGNNGVAGIGGANFGSVSNGNRTYAPADGTDGTPGAPGGAGGGGGGGGGWDESAGFNDAGGGGGGGGAGACPGAGGRSGFGGGGSFAIYTVGLSDIIPAIVTLTNVNLIAGNGGRGGDAGFGGSGGIGGLGGDGGNRFERSKAGGDGGNGGDGGDGGQAGGGGGGPSIGIVSKFTTVIKSSVSITPGTPGDSGPSAANAGASGLRAQEYVAP
jgi:hypothetical protein